MRFHSIVYHFVAILFKMHECASHWHIFTRSNGIKYSAKRAKENENEKKRVQNYSTKKEARSVGKIRNISDPSAEE